MKKYLKKIIVTLLTWEARLVLLKYKPKVIGITASVGKTTTKEAVGHVLATHVPTYRSIGSYNSEFGVPLTILQCESGWNNPLSWLRVLLEGLGLILFPNEYPEWLVLEMGVDHPGDMQQLVSWIKLDIAVLGRVGDTPVHVEYFDSPEQVAREKAHILDGLRPQGTFLRQADDPVISQVSARDGVRTVTYGYHKQANVRATYERIQYSSGKGQKYPEGISFKLDYANTTTPIALRGVFGASATYAALVAFAVGQTVGMTNEDIVAALETFKGMPGRLRIIEGKNNSVIIDDTYNSSPAALALALGHLSQIKYAKRKIAVLGDMLELGSHTAKMHQQAGEMVADIADLFYIVGPRMKLAKETAIAHGMSEEQVRIFSKADEAAKALEQDISPGDIVLVKGSQGIRLEFVVKEVMANQEDAEALLVRQSKAWKVLT